jgi:hypothetical protein
MNRHQRRANKSNNSNNIQTGLVRMSAFYKSDTTDGIALCLTPEDMNLDKFSEAIEEMIKHYDEPGNPMTPEFAFGQMQEVIDWANTTPLEFQSHRARANLCVIVCGNVQWLEKHGHIKPDEYNGMQYLRMRAAK